MSHRLRYGHLKFHLDVHSPVNSICHLTPGRLEMRKIITKSHIEPGITRHTDAIVLTLIQYYVR